jgi:hypothetical protein
MPTSHRKSAHLQIVDEALVRRCGKTCARQVGRSAHGVRDGHRFGSSKRATPVFARHCSKPADRRKPKALAAVKNVSGENQAALLEVLVAIWRAKERLGRRFALASTAALSARDHEKPAGGGHPPYGAQDDPEGPCGHQPLQASHRFDERREAMRTLARFSSTFERSRSNSYRWRTTFRKPFNSTSRPYSSHESKAGRLPSIAADIWSSKS